MVKMIFHCLRPSRTHTMWCAGVNVKEGEGAVSVSIINCVRYDVTTCLSSSQYQVVQFEWEAFSHENGFKTICSVCSAFHAQLFKGCHAPTNCATNFISHIELFPYNRQNNFLPVVRGKALFQPNHPFPTLLVCGVFPCWFNSLTIWQLDGSYVVVL